MQKNFTLKNTKNSINSQERGPKQTTINFIKQFARVCTMKQMSHKEFGAFVMN